jgi:hypothetical protein
MRRTGARSFLVCVLVTVAGSIRLRREYLAIVLKQVFGAALRAPSSKRRDSMLNFDHPLATIAMPGLAASLTSFPES